jgi:hypothetical protein
VHAGFGAQQAKSVFAFDLDGRSLDAGGVARGLVFNLCLETLALGVAQMLAQSQASVPPAPAWMSRKALSGSAGLLNIRRNSIFSTSVATAATSPSMPVMPASSFSSRLMANSSVLSASSWLSRSITSTTSSRDFFSLPSSCARLGLSQTLGSSSAALTSLNLRSLAG